MDAWPFAAVAPSYLTPYRCSFRLPRGPHVAPKVPTTSRPPGQVAGSPRPYHGSMSTDGDTPTNADQVEIGPTDSFDIRGPARGVGRSTLKSIAAAAGALVVLAIPVGFWGLLVLPIALALGVLVVLAETTYLRQKVRFQLTYDFLALPDRSVHSWQNISDLQLAPDGETLLIWVFVDRSVRGERSESDPVREEPVAVSLRGWPYPPDEIVATLVGQFEKYLAEVAVDDDPDAEVPAEFGTAVLAGLRVTQDFIDERPRQVLSEPTERALAEMIRALPEGSWLILLHEGDAARFLQTIRSGDGHAFRIEHRDVGAGLYRAETSSWLLVCRIALGWAKDDEDWRGAIHWEPFTLN